MNYRPDIDGLRALAVLSVLFCHVGLGLSGGYVGVDVFFVISGYLITRIMLKDLDEGRFSLVGFWERRIRRILPPLAFIVAVSFVAGWFISSPTVYYNFGQSVCELVLMKANVFFSHDFGYFAPSAETKPLLHTWSLAVEEQFYVVIPLLFWRAGRSSFRRRLLPILIVAAALSFGFATYGVVTGNPKAYFALAARAWELSVGVILAIRSHDRSPAAWNIGTRLRELLAAAAAAAIVVPMFVYDAATPFPGIAALPPVLGSVLLIYLGGDAERKTWVHRLLAHPTAVYVGLISYSLYLWHWPILVYGKALDLELPPLLSGSAIVFASFAMADLTRRLIETPFRTRRVLAGRMPLFAAAALVMIALHTGGRIVRRTDGFAQRMPPQVRNFVATGEIYRAASAHGVSPQRISESLLHLGASGIEPSVMLWGDSHAGSIIPAVERVLLAHGIAGRGFVRAGWSPVAEHLSEGPPEVFAAARTQDEEVKRYIRESGIRTVIFAAHWRRYRTHPRFEAALVRAVAELRAMGCDVCFMKDVPEFEYDVVGRMTQRAWHGRDTSGVSMSLADYDRRNRHYETLLPQLLALGAEVLDPLPAWRASANSTDLPACDAGGMYYYDSHHLSIYGSRLIDPMLEPVATKIAARKSSSVTTAALKTPTSAR